MAKLKFKYTIVNSQLVTTEREVEVEGESAIVRQTRAALEATSDESGHGTFSRMLPADLIERFPEGATLIVTIEVEA